MKRLMNFLILSCKKAAALIDKKSEAKLSWMENMQLSIHKTMCDACSAYEKQSILIDKALHNDIHSMKEDATSIIENKELQKKIISKL